MPTYKAFIMNKSSTSIVDFILVAQTNGITRIKAFLPRTHSLIMSNKVQQIRTPKDALAEGFDELGNRIWLSLDLRVLQDLSCHL
jgi:hypothetical protein